MARGEFRIRAEVVDHAGRPTTSDTVLFVPLPDPKPLHAYSDEELIMELHSRLDATRLEDD